MPSLSIGSKGDAVRALQQALIDQGYDLEKADGNFGAKTAEAVKKFQTEHGLDADGKVGKQTAVKLGVGDSFDGGQVRQPQRVDGDSFNGGGNFVAKFDRYPGGKGMASGNITLNGRSYRFNSGSSGSYSTPKGTYDVRIHDLDRDDGTFVRNGVGFTFSLDGQERDGSSVKSRSGRMWDPRKRETRFDLRIHPDGGPVGSIGCLALAVSASELERFRDDLAAAIRSNGGSLPLTVG